MRGLIDFLVGVVLFVGGIVSAFFYKKYKLLFLEQLNISIDERMENRLKSFKNEMYQEISKFM